MTRESAPHRRRLLSTSQAVSERVVREAERK
jgi:hypothetical protein